MKNVVVSQKIRYCADSSIYFSSLAKLPYRVWLDSGKPLSLYGRFDILSAAPKKRLANPCRAEIEDAVACLSIEKPTLSSSNQALPFFGGAIGYFNYAYNHARLGIDVKVQDNSTSMVGIFEWAIVQDHELRNAFLVYLKTAEQTIQSEVRPLLQNLNNLFDQEDPITTYLDSDLSEKDYASAYKKISNYILSGDTYQINFSRRFSGEFSGDPANTYLMLRKHLPSPYSAYLDLCDNKILSLSPEQFISVADKTAKTRPVKGTAARAETTEDDNKIANNLLNSDKNRAENLMIVDLLRNDFNKLCTPFSVKTNALFSLESFANVHHLVSEVEGELKDGVTPLECLIECFPGGSITGAPKKRAMEIINELETTPREIYCGSVFYLSCNGKLDSNIAIRTLMIDACKNIYCWGGGGIVADSRFHDEYQESLDKVNIILKALSGNS